MLHADRVTFGYDLARSVIQDVSLSVEPATMTAIIGPNGCGKSTLVRLLAGLLKPRSGTIIYRDRSLFTYNRRLLARRMAYVSQGQAITFPFSALEVVLTGRSPFGSPFQFESASDIEISREAMARMGITHLEKRRVSELSGGERQLVYVARALAQQPECLLLDEPSSSLDLRHRSALLRTLLELRLRIGLTVVMVTHDLNMVEPAFDRVLALRDGESAASGTPAEVLRESTLAEIYGDVQMRARRADGRLCIWSEVGAE